jgi:hypothetical protein
MGKRRERVSHPQMVAQVIVDMFRQSHQLGIGDDDINCLVMPEAK